MHIIHKETGAPKIFKKDISKNTSSFTISPLPRGYGVTIGNSLRRTLLSSIPGTKVTGIKVSGVTHEYSTLPGVKDSVIDIMLNLKNLVITKVDNGVEWMKLQVSKSGVVTAKDIKKVAGIEILNEDLYITEIDKDGLELDIDIRVEKGVGYLTVEELKEREEDTEVLLIDTNFSPVSNVQYKITNTRFEDIINLDSLELVISTSGAISPVDALRFSGDMMASYFGLFNEESLQVEGEFITDIKDVIKKEKEEVKEELEKETYTPIEIMGLSPRTLNALINGSILSIEQLVKCTETKLSSIKGFGKKAMVEIRASLKERDLKLLGDD
ncbi:DNA-directed RNA polymerase subunit alpha [Candidatus Gracilibacteria bacterium]|nr:MAG: DNA-directed RNA polymerase subunit alpha [Candidatus Gracilibacteria bacterium]PIE85054.1 MAG: DNA-directed RNA polymerase subunit alpha [Candidatus Gracilibacteria bacterium]